MGRRNRLHARKVQLREDLQGHLREGKPGQTWYRIENLVQSPGTACVYLYGEVGMWGVTSEDFVRDLNGISASSIELHINSMGGEAFEGIAILNALRAHRATVTTYVDGLAASIASVIAMAGERVVMGQNTTMMIHEAHVVAVGEASDLRAMADLLDKTNDNMASIYAAKAGTDTGQWREAMRAETWYSAEEAVAAGLADEVDGAPAEDAQQREPAMAAAYDLSVFRYPGRQAAPAPAASAAEPEPEPVEEPAVVEPPVVDPAPALVEPATDPDVDDEPDETPAAEPEPAQAVTEPSSEPEPDDPVAALLNSDPAVEPEDTVWAAMTCGLLADSAPSTVDELLHALIKEGTPA